MTVFRRFLGRDAEVEREFADMRLDLVRMSLILRNGLFSHEHEDGAH